MGCASQKKMRKMIDLKWMSSSMMEMVYGACYSSPHNDICMKQVIRQVNKRDLLSSVINNAIKGKCQLWL